MAIETKGKKMSKVAMSFRVDESLRDSFIEKCKSENIPASVAIREFMKGFIAKPDNEPIFTYRNANKFTEEELAFLRERSRLAGEDEKVGRLIPADVAIKNLHTRIAKRKEKR